MSKTKDLRRTIQLEPKIYDELTNFCVKSETYNDGVKRLLFLAKNGSVAKLQKQQDKVMAGKL